MQQILATLAVPTVMLSAVLSALVATAMVLGCRRAKARGAGSRLILAIGAACLVWAVIAIATAPLR